MCCSSASGSCAGTTTTGTTTGTAPTATEPDPFEDLDPDPNVFEAELRARVADVWIDDELTEAIRLRGSPGGRRRGRRLHEPARFDPDELLDDDRQLHPGEWRSDAGVRSVAERNVAVR